MAIAVELLAITILCKMQKVSNGTTKNEIEMYKFTNILDQANDFPDFR